MHPPYFVDNKEVLTEGSEDRVVGERSACVQ